MIEMSPGLMKIITEISESQHRRANQMPTTLGYLAPYHAEAHAQLATMLDLWNRFVCRIPGLDENSLRVNPSP